MSSKVFNQFYRQIFADLKVDEKESQKIKKKLLETNPPPDKLVWLRASAFRIGSEFLSENKSRNVNLLKCINAIIHAIETTCMIPTVEDNGNYFDTQKAEELYRAVLQDVSVNRDENNDLKSFFKTTNTPPKNRLTWARATMFRIGSEYLSDNRAKNVALLKSINILVHAFETSCLRPRPYELKKQMPLNISVAEAVQHIWDLDDNRLDPNDDYKVNVQGGKKPYWQDDSASDPLFSYVDRSALNRPTYRAFIALLDNYTSQVGVAEEVTREERIENRVFINAIMETAPMQFCHKYCASKSRDVPSNPNEFKKLLNKIWFSLYRRAGRGGDSSGFEHVFVGEIKNGKVSGFHNWIYFYYEERKGHVDYRGYIRPKSRNSARTNGDDQVLTLQFKWKGVLKNVGTSFIGVSPEFEIALYTMMFLLGEEENIFDLDTGNDKFKLNCKVFTMGKDKIGTSFVEAIGHED